MKRIVSILISLMVILVSCDDNPVVISPKLSSYYYAYMQYPLSAKDNPDTDNLVKLDYNGDKVIKRTGGLLAISPTTGFDYMYSELLYDNIIHSENQIIIRHYIQGDDSATLLDESIIEMDSQYRIAKKSIFDTYSNRTDTIFYSYNSDGILIQSIQKRPFSSTFISESSLYYYNENSNLDSVVTNRTIENEFVGKTREIFSHYDGSSNPLKKLGIFEEIFYRSISVNNYSLYQMYEYDEENNRIKEEERSWSFSYDKAGNIEFDEY